MQSNVEKIAQEVAKSSGMDYPHRMTESPLKGNRRDVFSLDEGQVILEWPEKMSAESYEDFQSWVELQLRKIKRSIN